MWRRLPWITLALAGGAWVVFRLGWEPALQFDRAALARGEFWRLLSGHLCHFGREHLSWDLAVFVGCGAMLEPGPRRSLLALLGVAAIAVSAAVWGLQPHLVVYRGLSGVDSALFAALATRIGREGLLRRHLPSVFLAAAALIGFAAKSACELLAGETVFVVASHFEPVPLAHLVGAATGAGWAWQQPTGCHRRATATGRARSATEAAPD